MWGWGVEHDKTVVSKAATNNVFLKKCMEKLPSELCCVNLGPTAAKI